MSSASEVRHEYSLRKRVRKNKAFEDANDFNFRSPMRSVNNKPSKYSKSRHRRCPQQKLDINDNSEFPSLISHGTKVESQEPMIDETTNNANTLNDSDDSFDDSTLNFSSTSWADMMDEVDEAKSKRRRRKLSLASSATSDERLSNIGSYSDEFETDPAVLERREKQISYGKNCEDYKKYLEAVEKNNRKPRHPQTPQKHLKMSRRGFDSYIRNWRKAIHFWSETSSPKESQNMVESFLVEMSSNTPKKPTSPRIFSALRKSPIKTPGKENKIDFRQTPNSSIKSPAWRSPLPVLDEDTLFSLDNQ